MVRRIALAGLAGMAALAFIAANTVQAAENHNSSRSNRTNTIAAPGGNTGGGPAPTNGASKGYISCNGGNGIAQPGKGCDTGNQGSVAVKEEGVKSKMEQGAKSKSK
ncbi:MAG: hypothetical protein L6R19_28850 [Alphaproteobacteria bacterium]|nr:hypothetical protein [Alphaproteobacteria bacterium]